MSTDHPPTEEDLEAAYLRALTALESAEGALHEALTETAEELEAAGGTDTGTASVVSVGEHLDAAPSRSGGPIEPAPNVSDPSTSKTVAPLQIIEGALFVGGDPLTTRNLRTLFRGDVSTGDVVELIDQLNERYSAESRPYEVRLHEGGYVLELRPDFHPLRRKVFGLGPREVKLTQDAVEVLSLVAYHQPTTKEEIEELGKSNPSPMLRHLLRRELIQLERSDDNPEIHYRTTNRFLTLVGIEDLEDLPRAEALTFR